MVKVCLPNKSEKNKSTVVMTIYKQIEKSSDSFWIITAFRALTFVLLERLAAPGGISWQLSTLFYSSTVKLDFDLKYFFG